MFSNKFTKFLVTSLFVGLFGLVIACGGGEEELDVTSETPAEKPAETTSSKPAEKPAETTSSKSEFEEGSLNVTLEIISPPTAIDVLEGKAQFKTPGSEEWVDVIDAQPIETGWSVRTLAVSRAFPSLISGISRFSGSSIEVGISPVNLFIGFSARVSFIPASSCHFSN